MPRAAVAIIAAIGALALLSWSSDGRTASHVSHDPRLATPATDLLRSARGTIWWVDAGCRVELVRLPSGARVRGGTGHCRLWPAPSGRVALATAGTSTAALLARDGARSILTSVFPRRTTLESSPTWAPDSSALAFCATRGAQPEVMRLQVSPTRYERPLRHRCAATWTRGSRLITSDGHHVYGQGQRLIDRTLPLLVHGSRRSVEVTAMAESPAGLVLALSDRAVPNRTMLVTVHPNGNVARIDLVPRGTVDAIGVSPDGAWLSIGYQITGATRIVAMDAAKPPPAVPALSRGLAFSPDGRFVAVALPGALRVVNLVTGDFVTLPHVDPSSVSWTR